MNAARLLAVVCVIVLKDAIEPDALGDEAPTIAVMNTGWCMRSAPLRP